MAYALINLKGEVLEIKEEPFTTSNPNLEVVIINNGVVEGDELNYYIIVSELKESENEEPYRIATAYSGIRQTAALQRLRLDNQRLESANQQLTQDHAALLLQLAEKGVL